MKHDSRIVAMLQRLKELREKQQITREDLERRLELGQGWIEHFEEGEALPTLDVLNAILFELGSSFADLAKDVHGDKQPRLSRCLVAVPADDGVELQFPYGRHDASYLLKGATLPEFEQVLRLFQDSLGQARQLEDADSEASKAIKANAVAGTFLRAVALWPTINPSDIWGFLISRAYCDPFNHPADSSRLDLGQSWKRTGGWALELVLKRYYEAFLRKAGIDIAIPTGPAKEAILADVTLDGRVEADKVDVMLLGEHEGDWHFFGVVHVKASFAERRTDDQPLSAALIDGGYTSPLWTLDLKSMPASRPYNKGELGAVNGKRSAKRKDIEDDGFFSGCFSYNANTLESPDDLPAERRIYRCNFSDPDDAFSRFIIERWQTFRSEL